MKPLAQRDTFRCAFLSSLVLLVGACHGPEGAAPAPDAADGGNVETAPFAGRRLGNAIQLDASQTAALFCATCDGGSFLEKRTASGWGPLQDDRPPSYDNPGVYMDGYYQAPDRNNGCDVSACTSCPETRTLGYALEYIKTGTRAAPSDAPPGAASPVDAIESRVYTGELRATVTYFETAQCIVAEARKVVMPVSVAEQGVCCPTGSLECGSAGPGGGWAASLDQCSAWSTQCDAAYRIQRDSHGCDQLVVDDALYCSSCTHG